MDTVPDNPPQRDFTNAEMGAIAHLYRGEIYRSTIWRTRLDTTTNWSVVTLGIALSIAFSSPEASPLPLVLVGILILLFLALEARRYRYFNVWRARARWMETNLYVPILNRQDLRLESGWAETLAEDYMHPVYHVRYLTAVGRRIRRNYLWILMIQTVAYTGKLLVHPTPVKGVSDFITRADIGPIPGELVLVAGTVYVMTWTAMAIWSERQDRAKFHSRGTAPSSMG